MSSRAEAGSAIIFDVLRALNLTMTNYEAVYGEIRRPEGGWNSP